jgi:transcriptional regulator with XRE-family HTH domain
MDKLTQLNELFAELRAQGRVHTQQDLAELIGVHKSTLSSAFNGNPKYLTESLLSKVAEATMPYQMDDASAWRIPLIPVEAHAGHLAEFADAVNDYDCEKVVSPVRGASFAIQVTGDSMAPAYPSGAKILCQRVNETAFVEWGRVYLLDTVNGAILKQVRKSDRPDCVCCCSLNPSPEYAPFDVELRHITGWYRVLMIMSLV